MREDYKLIVEENEVRGLHCLSLTPDFLVPLGRAFGVFVREAFHHKKGKPYRLALGFDARPSSIDLQNAFQRGLAAEGVNVLNVGLAPAPLVYFSIHRLKTDGAVIVTGSHRAAGWNGIRFYLGRQPLPGRTVEEILSQARSLGRRDLLPMAGRVTYLNMVPDYLRTLQREFAPLKALNRNGPLRVVVAGGNGAASLTAPVAFTRLGCRVLKYGCSLEGPKQSQAHDPSDPLFLNETGSAVRAAKADFGVLFDGDGDRVRVVDHKGEPVRPDHLLMLFARSVAERVDGCRVACDLGVSDLLDELLEPRGATVMRVPSGHGHLMHAIHGGEVLLAGSSDGHYHFADRSYGNDDGLYAALRLAEIIARRRSESGRRETLRSVLPEIDRYVALEKVIPFRAGADPIGPVAEYLKECAGNGGGIVSVETEARSAVAVHGEGAWGIIAAAAEEGTVHMRYEGRTEESFRRIGAILRESLDAALEPAGTAKTSEHAIY